MQTKSTAPGANARTSLLASLWRAFYACAVIAPLHAAERTEVAPAVTDSAAMSIADSTSAHAADGSPVLEMEDRTVRSHHRYHATGVSQSSSSLQGKALDRRRGLSLGDALQAMPGVTVVHTGSTLAKPAIRGLNGNRIVILNNGVRQEGQQWGSEHAPEIDPYLASKLTVIQGASSVRYGADALGGVVLVEPWPLREEPGFGGEFHLAGFTVNREGNISATIEGAPAWASDLSWRLQGTVKKGGDVATPEYNLDNTGIEEINQSAALGWQKPDMGLDLFYSRFQTKLGIFSGSHIGNVSDLQTAISRGRPERITDFSYEIDRPYQDVTHQFAKAHAYLATPMQGKLNFAYGLQDNLRAEYDHKPLNDAKAARNLPELEFEIMTHTADLSWDFHPQGRYDMALGMSGMSQFNTYTGRPFIPNFLNYSGGVFASLLQHGESMDFEGGVRYDTKWLKTYAREKGEVVTNAFDFNNASAMVGAVWRIADGLSGKLHVSTAFRPPGVNELFSAGLHHGAAAVEYGDPGLQPERAYDGTLSLQAKRERWSGECTVYRTAIRDFIYLSPEFPPTLTIRGAFPTFRYHQADASMWGGDAALRFTWWRRGGDWDYVGQASVLRARNEATGDYLILMPADRVTHGVEWSLPKWRRLHDLHLGGTVQTVWKQTHAPADSLDYAPPPPGYTLLGFTAGFQWNFGENASVQFEAEAENVLNTAYRDYTNRFRYYADDRGRNFALRVKIPFDRPSEDPRESM
jgi:iron complex outermembrane recepter protein